MPDRYTAHDYDAAWQVWDNVERRSVGGSFTEAGALAEAARLNGKAPTLAKAVDAWAVVGPDLEIDVDTISTTAAGAIEHLWLGDSRIARVRITEIEGGDSHG